MDRYKYDFTHHSNTVKQAQTKEKWDRKTQDYTALTDELMRDIPALIGDKNVFFAPVIASYNTTLNRYYTEVAQLAGQLVASVAHINRAAAAEHQAVVSKGS